MSFLELRSYRSCMCADLRLSPKLRQSRPTSTRSFSIREIPGSSSGFRSYERVREIARSYNVHHSTISRLKAHG